KIPRVVRGRLSKIPHPTPGCLSSTPKRARYHPYQDSQVGPIEITARSRAKMVSIDSCTGWLTKLRLACNRRKFHGVHPARKTGSLVVDLTTCPFFLPLHLSAVKSILTLTNHQ